MKSIYDRSNVTAYVVLNKRGRHVATVQFLHTHKAVQCEVHDNAGNLLHQQKAGGYGYDKATAALTGAVIDKHLMANHCGHVESSAMLSARRDPSGKMNYTDSNGNTWGAYSLYPVSARDAMQTYLDNFERRRKHIKDLEAESNAEKRALPGLPSQ